jgi:uncharacterized protein
MRVLVDANALMMPVELDVRVFDELDRLLGGIEPRPRIEPESPNGPVEQSSTMATDETETGATDPAVPAGTGANAGDGTRASVDDLARGYAESGIDGVELIVPAAVLDELDSLSGAHGTEAVAASVGADLAGERCVAIPHEKAYADDAVVELATDRRADISYVVTNDRALTGRLLAQDVPVICLRGHDQLTIRTP